MHYEIFWSGLDVSSSLLRSKTILKYPISPIGICNRHISETMCDKIPNLTVRFFEEYWIVAACRSWLQSSYLIEIFAEVLILVALGLIMQRVNEHDLFTTEP